MPVCLVKSLPSSTSAFAGSHAAQQRVSDLSSARAVPLRASPAMPDTSATVRDVLCQLIFVPSSFRPLRSSKRDGCNGGFHLLLSLDRGAACLVFCLVIR